MLERSAAVAAVAAASIATSSAITFKTRGGVILWPTLMGTQTFKYTLYK